MSGDWSKVAIAPLAFLEGGVAWSGASPVELRETEIGRPRPVVPWLAVSAIGRRECNSDLLHGKQVRGNLFDFGALAESILG